jgi:LDH2 family malate/lactate/ureidoglycolate dehydrogenase
MKTVPFKDLKSFGIRFLKKLGASDAAAEYVSDIITRAESNRQSTHGIVQFKALQNSFGKSLDAAAEPKIVSDKGAAVLIDADRCMGLLSYKVAIEKAQEKARKLGIGMAAIRNGDWVGALAIPLIPVARAGLLAQAFAQTNTCKDCAPVGGIDARFSTNPIAVAFPADPDPVVADFSTATMSMAAANGMAAKGERSKVERFIDGAGKATCEAAVIKKGGTLMFMGGDTDGHKGYALSLFTEALTVMAGGSANNPDRPTHQCTAVMVIDPEFFGGMDYYKKEMARFTRFVKAARVRPDFSAVRLPGERGFAALKRAESEGVPLDDGKTGILNAIAKEAGIEPLS